MKRDLTILAILAFLMVLAGTSCAVSKPTGAPEWRYYYPTQMETAYPTK